MTNSQRLATVRCHLRWWLAQNAGPAQATIECENEIQRESLDQILSESILIVDGFYAGRTFEAASFRATWFMEPDELKIHDQDRSVVAVFRGDEITDQHPAVVQDQAAVKDQVAEVTAQERVEVDQEEEPVSLPISAAKTSQKDVAAGSEHDQDGDIQLPKAA